MSTKATASTAVNPQMADVQKIAISILVNDFDADGNLIGPSVEKGTISVVPDNPAIGTFVADATPAPGTTQSGFLVGQKVLGTVNFTISGLKADGTTAWFAPVVDSIDVIVGPVSASLASVSLAPPVAQ
jgi:hypothetical protein